MLNYALLAGAMIMSAPAIAQEQQPQPAKGEMSTAPTTDTAPIANSAAAPAQSAPTANDPVSAADQATTATADTTSAATGADKVAQVVDTEFPTYDKNADGALSSTEFGTWMVALRTASDASLKAGSKEMKAWTASAFAQADIDKSKTVSKVELTGFLAKGQS